MEERAAPTFRSQVMFFGFIQMVLKLRAFITVPILSRVIGTEGYGTLSALLAFTGMAQMLLLFGIPTSLTVFIPWLDSKEKKSKEFWMVAQVMLVAALAAVVLLLALNGFVLSSLFMPGFNRLCYFLALALVPLNVMNAVLYSQIINNRQAKPYAKLATIATVAELSFLLIVVWLWGLRGVLLSSIFGQTLTVTFMAALVMKETPFAKLSTPLIADMKKYYTYSVAIFVTSLAGWVIDSGDRLIIGKYRTINELGIYQVSYGLCTHTAELAAPLFATLMPFVATAVSESNFDSAKEYLEKSFRALVMLFVPVVVFFSLEARDMLTLLSVPSFYAGAAIVPWVVSGIAMHQILGVYTFNLHAHKKGAFIIISVGFAALLNIVLNFIFVPKYGIIAAAISTCAAYALHFVIIRLISRKFLDIGMSAAHILKVGLSAAALAAVILVVSRVVHIPVLRLGISLIAGGGCYSGLLLLLRAVSDDDRVRAFAYVGGKLPRFGRGGKV